MAEGLYVPLVPLQGERDEEEGGEDLSEVEEEHVYSPNGTDVNVLLARAGSPKENAPALDIKSRYLYFSRFIPNFIGSSFCSWAVEHKARRRAFFFCPLLTTRSLLPTPSRPRSWDSSCSSASTSRRLRG